MRLRRQLIAFHSRDQGGVMARPGWAGVITLLFKDLENLAGALDTWLWLLQILGAIILFGAVGLAAWSAYLTWTDGRRWPRKLWSVLLVLATLTVLYVAANFGLLSMTVAY